MKKILLLLVGILMFSSCSFSMIENSSNSGFLSTQSDQPSTQSSSSNSSDPYISIPAIAYMVNFSLDQTRSAFYNAKQEIEIYSNYQEYLESFNYLNDYDEEYFMTNQLMILTIIHHQLSFAGNISSIIADYSGGCYIHMYSDVMNENYDPVFKTASLLYVSFSLHLNLKPDKAEIKMNYVQPTEINYSLINDSLSLLSSISESKLFTNYQDFSAEFTSSNITQATFENNSVLKVNYAGSSSQKYYQVGNIKIYGNTLIIDLVYYCDSLLFDTDVVYYEHLYLIDKITLDDVKIIQLSNPESVEKLDMTQIYRGGYSISMSNGVYETYLDYITKNDSDFTVDLSFFDNCVMLVARENSYNKYIFIGALRICDFVYYKYERTYIKDYVDGGDTLLIYRVEKSVYYRFAYPCEG